MTSTSPAAATAWCGCAPGMSRPTPRSRLEVTHDARLPSAPRPALAPPAARMPLVLRLALRELRGGLQRLRDLPRPASRSASRRSPASRRSRARSPRASTREGRRILGGDMAFSLIHRRGRPGRAGLPRSKGQGRRVVASMRAMAMAGDKGSGLVELKAVDGAYPAVGDARDRSAAAARRPLCASGTAPSAPSSTRRCSPAST